ncbi:M16 family metallopeptidase [Streptosporangium sp. NPDC087985]|uniref:M16 family metallopeptidase n=1 Tax=Streptosporangium sp. NPDC087985 TaxID=3366196 RepID=UPI0037F7536D
MNETTRATLPNGLRLILAPDPCASMVGISLHYGVGFRSEPRGKTGFAHLFEHLMFQGSETVAAGEHGRLVQAAGGSFNGSTGPDATNFYQTVPNSAIERVLFLEADRLRSPRLTERALVTQLAVVKEEIRRNVIGKPYGRFPWPVVPQTLYRNFANTHDGYGDFSDLDRMTTEDCEQFFDAYYHPGNCVLAISGDFIPHQVAGLVDKYFSEIPAKAVTDIPGNPAVEFPEPHRVGEFEQVQFDERAPMPAVALGYRLPDPATALGDYLAHMVLSTVLTDGMTGRLNRRLAESGLGTVTIRSGCGLVGGPLRAREPDTFVISAYHPQDVSDGQIVSVIDGELSRLLTAEVPEEELRGAAMRSAAAWSRAHDQVGRRARTYGRLESLFGAAELTHDLPRLLGKVTSAEIAAAAQRLHDGARARVNVRPAPPAQSVPTPIRSTSGPGSLTAPPPEEQPSQAAQLPPMAPLQPAQPSPITDVTLDSGLRVVAIRSDSVPLISLRLRIPLPAGCDAAAAAVLGAMLLRQSRCAGGAELEHAGWTVVPLADTRQLILSGNGPAVAIAKVLRILATALADPAGYDAADVDTTRTLIAQQITALNAHPATVARAALRRQRLGDHPGIREYASADAVAIITAADLEAFHSARLSPAEAALVLVGDLDPDLIVRQVIEALSPWRSVRAAGELHLPDDGRQRGPYPARRGFEVIHRPGAAQTQIRFGAPWAEPEDPIFPVLEIANAAFGGHFSSRLSTELREKRGLTYSARSVIEPDQDGSTLTVSFDTRKETADQAITEFYRVVDEVTSIPFDVTEFENARDHTIGRWLAGVESQSDLANAITGRLALGLPPAAIFDYSRQLATVRYEDVRLASQKFITPDVFAGVAIGDADSISPDHPIMAGSR